MSILDESPRTYPVELFPEARIGPIHNLIPNDGDLSILEAHCLPVVVLAPGIELFLRDLRELTEVLIVAPTLDLQPATFDPGLIVGTEVLGKSLSVRDSNALTLTPPRFRSARDALERPSLPMAFSRTSSANLRASFKLAKYPWGAASPSIPRAVQLSRDCAVQTFGLPSSDT